MQETTRFLRRQAIPALAVVIAFFVTLLLWPFGQPASFVPFIAAVIVAAWRGGLRGSLVSTGLSVLALAILHSLQLGTLQTETGEEFALRLGLFAFMGVAAGYLAMQCQRAVASHDRLQHALADAGEAWIFADTQGRVTFLNPLAEAWTGWSQSQARHRPLDQLFVLQHDDSRTPIPLATVRVIEQRVAQSFPDDAVLLAAGGSAIPVEGSIRPLQNADDQVVELMLTFRDASAARQAAQETAAKTQQSQAALAKAEGGAQARTAELRSEHEQARTALVAQQAELARQLEEQNQTLAAAEAGLKEAKAAFEKELHDLRSRLAEGEGELHKKQQEQAVQAQRERAARQQLERQLAEEKGRHAADLLAKQAECDRTAEECLQALTELDGLRQALKKASSQTEALQSACRAFEERIRQLEAAHRAALDGTQHQLAASHHAEAELRQAHAEATLHHEQALASQRQLHQALEQKLLRAEQAEREANRQAESLRAFLDACPHGLCAFDGQRRITLWNPALAQLTGRTAAEMLGQPVHAIFPELETSGSHRHSSWALDWVLLGDTTAVEVRRSSRGRIEIATAPLRADDEAGAVAVVWETLADAPAKPETPPDPGARPVAVAREEHAPAGASATAPDDSDWLDYN